LDIATQTQLIFGVADVLAENIRITKQEQSLVLKQYPPLLSWVNEYT
jgi:hypothetical protein